MKRILSVLAVLSLLSTAGAATIAPCNDCWMTYDPVKAVDATGIATNPYFVNQSQDGPKQGLGFILNQYTNLQYVTSGHPAPLDAPSGFFFLDAPSHQLQAEFLTGVTQDSLQLGWYDVQNPNNLNPLFTRTGGASSMTLTPATTVNFTPTTQFGFYVKYLNVGIPGNICAALLSAASSNLWATNTSACYDPAKAPLLTTNQVVYTQSALNSSGPNSEIAWEQIAKNIPAALSGYHQHFVALQDQSTGRFIVGMEDTFGRDALENRGPLPNRIYEGNGDYQDFAITFGEPRDRRDPPDPPALSSVPEPSTLVGLGLGLAVLGVRRFASKRG